MAHCRSLAAAALAAALHAPATAQPDGPPPVPLGGPATVRDESPEAFRFASPTLTGRERRAFAVGRSFFEDAWVEAPSSAVGRDGLGPLFHARSCSACHARGGRGRPPEAHEDGSGTGLLFRIGVWRDGAADAPHPVYGNQLQDHAILGVSPEARVVVAHELRRGHFADGASWSLAAPTYRVVDAAYGSPGDAATIGPRIAPQLVGLGLLEAVPEADLLELADPDDQDGDGISGRVHLVRDLRSGRMRAGRFGWKATQPTVEQQCAAAFAEDLGITSSLFPHEALTAAEAVRIAFASGGTPELDDHKLARVAFYCQTLAVPAQRTPTAAEVRRGEALFERMACARCHVPTLRTGDAACTEGYRDVTFRPYTDLLLHDLGPELADGKQDGDAAPSEWRTAPLWGIGLFAATNGHTRYLHDGRARDLEQAVLWHGGEAEGARRAYLEAPAAQRRALLAFLRSL